MNNKNEFSKWASGHLGMSNMHLEKYMQESVKAFTPNIIEERQMNVAALDVFSRLMMDRTIFLGVGVDDYVANVIQAQLLFLESVDKNEDIKIFVNSPGGSVIDGLGIYDTMQYVNPDVSTICTGMAASMGAVLLAAGSNGKRKALKHSRVMIHQPSSASRGTFKDMEISLKLMDSLKQDLYNILAEHTGNTYDRIEDDCDRDYWFSANEAKDYGLIDEVIVR